MENGLETRDTGLACKYGMMVLFMKDNGSMTKLVGKDDSFMQMEMFTKAVG